MYLMTYDSAKICYQCLLPTLIVQRQTMLLQGKAKCIFERQNSTKRYSGKYEVPSDIGFSKEKAMIGI